MLFITGSSEGIKTAAVISLCVGAFNLIPCQPLDGGNILHFLLGRVMGDEKGEKICFFISCAVLAPMAALGLAVMLRSGNITLLTVSAYLAAAMFINKKENNKIKI